MPLSDGTVIGLCYAFCIGAAQLYVLFSTEGAAQHLKPEGKDVLRTMGRALLYAGSAAAAVAAMDWLGKRIDDHRGHGPSANIVTFLVIGWAFSVLCLAIDSAAKRVMTATGVNVLKEARFRVIAIAIPIGLICSFVYLFGPHLTVG